MSSSCHFRTIDTPIGSVLAIVENDALIGLDFIDDIYGRSDHKILLSLEEQLMEYFAKEREVFTIPLSPLGTTFQKGVWDTLLKIPYGSKISYKKEAELFGDPKASRAVANANGRNPISILIPCHRVVSSDGTIGGYSGGVWRKEFLLLLENS